MEGCAVTACSCLSTRDLLALQAEVDDTLALVLKVDTYAATRAAEVRMGRLISGAWRQAAERGLEGPLQELVGQKPTRGRVSRFVKALGVKLSKPLSKDQIAAVHEQAKRVWSTAKKLAATQARHSFSFSHVDSRAIAAVNQQQIFWVNNFYSKHLSARIQAVAEDVMIEQGLGLQEAGRELGKALRQEFGLRAGGKSRFAPSVPAQFAGNPDRYLQGVVSTAAHQARTFGRITAFDEAGVVQYMLVNPMDTRTGVICQEMHGQVFTVDVGKAHMEKLLGAKDPEDVKDISPWLSGSDLKAELAGARKGSAKASEVLAEAGVVLPPFHPLCRTEPVIQ